MAISNLVLCSIFFGAFVFCSHIQGPRTLKQISSKEVNRPTRGFSDMLLSTSRGFGKRADESSPRCIFDCIRLGTARSFGKRTPSNDQLAVNSILLKLLAAENKLNNWRTANDWVNRDDYK